MPTAARLGGAFQRSLVAKALKAGKKVIALAEELPGKCTEGCRMLKEVEVEMRGQGVRSDNYASQGNVLEQVHGAREADVDSENGDGPGTK